MRIQRIPLGDGDRTVVLDLFKAKPSSPCSRFALRAAPGGAAQP
ncbi:MAG TPA: hypothetical protein VM686_13155 [Polyangiaceae bacterium]|nr:hypothetical protein [Polyangiaceae bacterium]